MKSVVDTNVLAYFLLETQPFYDESDEFLQSMREPIAPAQWEAELAHVLWLSVRAGVIPPEKALPKLQLASGLGIQSVPNQTLWLGALTRSIQSGVAVYDTLFVELAEREGLPLATFDHRLLGAFPHIAKRPRKLLRKQAN